MAKLISGAKQIVMMVKMFKKRKKSRVVNAKKKNENKISRNIF